MTSMLELETSLRTLGLDVDALLAMTREKSNPEGTLVCPDSLVCDLGTEFERQNTSDSNVLAAEFKRQKSLSFKALPQALRGPARGLPYSLREESTMGVQFDGITKYIGAGMNTTLFECKDILEFSSYFVPTKPISGVSYLLGPSKTYAEFVTNYDPTSCRLTIFKAFLNGILPAGLKAGVSAAAE
jgi:hypothetical protein